MPDTLNTLTDLTRHLHDLEQQLVRLPELSKEKRHRYAREMNIPPVVEILMGTGAEPLSWEERQERKLLLNQIAETLQLIEKAELEEKRIEGSANPDEQNPRQKSSRPAGRPKGFQCDGEKFKGLRRETGLTQAKLCDKSDVDVERIKTAESAGRLSSETIKKLATAFTRIVERPINWNDLTKEGK